MNTKAVSLAAGVAVAALALVPQAGACAATATPATPAATVEALQDEAGTLADGSRIMAITLKARNGVSARILSYGATLQSLVAPDRQGHLADVLLGYDDLAGYVDHPNFFGVTVGRVANRIAGGRFTLDGKSFQLPLNDNKVNSLHGGGQGFDKQVWQVVAVRSGPVASVELARVSPDGEAGYPGTVRTSVTYSLDNKGDLTIAFAASTDKPTIINMTNHGIFNLAGEGSPDGAMDEVLTIPARAYTPVDAALIPTGELRPVVNTVFDFTGGRRLADGLRDGTDPQIVAGRGYDHNFALDKGVTASPELVARLEDRTSGRVLEVLSTEPGVQLYTGNFLDGTLVGKHGHVYRMGDGIALEPQKFPDAVHHPAFVSTRVDPGKPYRHVMIYRVTTSR